MLPLTPICSLLFLLLATTLALGAPPAEAPEPQPVTLDPNQSDFPASSLVDFSYLHDRPTGLNGDMFAGQDGHFYFENGKRARFWGLNIAKGSVFVPKPVIDETIKTIDRAGFNLVRFHHFDDFEGLLPKEAAGSSERFDLGKLALLDYWISELGKRGIYVYLDLLDYRTFHEAEDVQNGPALGRGAKPYAFFDRRLIMLQQQYARKLLIDHINPYTRLSYAQDPTVCLIELCDENGLFIRAKDWQTLVSPYREQLQSMWNDWLKDRYGDTATLTEAWTDADNKGGLLAGEKLEQNTVRLFPQPARDPGFPAPTAAPVDPEAGEVGRVADRRLFFVSLHQRYFRQMSDYLRSHGVRQPLTAVTDSGHLSDQQAVASSLDFVGMNFYYDHPAWQRGNEWRLPGFFENANPLADQRVETFVPRVCSGRVYGKPLVVREWNVCWPNKFRAAGTVEAAVYGALQDLDAMILFTYDVRPGRRQLEFFDVRSDPTRWGVSGLCASLFLKRQVAPARRKAAIAYSSVDTHYPTYQPLPTEIYKLGWVSQVSNLFFDQKLDKKPDLVVASGRTSGSAYPGERTIICGNWPAADLLDHQRDKSADQLSGYELATVPEKTQDFSFGGTMFDSGQKHRLMASPGYLLADVQQNPDLRPIGVGEDGEMCLGFRDMKRRNYVFRRLNAVHELRVALDAVGQLFEDPVSHRFMDDDRFVSDTGQVKRLMREELLVVNAPQAQILAGSLQARSAESNPMLSLKTQSPLGALVCLSLDGKPLRESSRWSLKMVTTATNTGEEKTLHLSTPDKTLYALTALGKAPIETLGRPSGTPTTVSLDGKQVISLDMVNGLWELVCMGASYYVYCDTPGIKFSLPALRERVRVTVYTQGGECLNQEATQPLTYPGNAAMVVVKNW